MYLWKASLGNLLSRRTSWLDGAKEKKEAGSALVILTFVLGITVPLAVIGGLSSFNAGSATVAQRVWTMCWLSFGALAGYIDATGLDIEEDPKEYTTGSIGIIILFCAPAIGGFVVVGQMLSHYGVCTRIT